MLIYIHQDSLNKVLTNQRAYDTLLVSFYKNKKQKTLTISNDLTATLKAASR